MMKSLQGLAAIALLLPLHVSGFFRMPCDQLTNERLDPLLSPGAVASHLHTVVGGSNFHSKPSSTSTMQKSLCTTCKANEDKSAYWTPDLLFAHQNGSFLHVEGQGILAYYLFRGDEKVNAFPSNFAMIAGDANVRSNEGQLFQKRDSVSYACLGGGGPETSTIPKDATSRCSGGLRAQVFFPSCWNGKKSTAPYTQHVTYPSQSSGNGRCPSSHPIKLISLFIERVFAVDRFKGMSGQLVFANGDLTGYSFHGDFMNGWNPSVLQRAVDTCTNDSGRVEDCPVLTLQDQITCARSPTVNEAVTGVFKKLPGNNPIQAGPGRASTKPETSPPAMFPNPIAFVGSPPPGTKMLNGRDVFTGDANYKYSYCLKDDISRRSMRKSVSVKGDMTVPKCLAACKTKGYTYCGLEYAAECYGDTAIQNGAKEGGKCDMPCKGDSKTYCGGAGAMSLYTFKSASKSKRSLHTGLSH